MEEHAGRHNARTSHPAVKRILRELKEIQMCDNPDIAASALEENIFEWLFVIRGAWGTEFEGGLYHGRILMPAEYPFKPPAFVMLTPSGRFETKTKICLSISSFHPESWQPSWSVQSALVALIAFMQTPGQGAVGSLECSADIRREMAFESRTCIPQVSNPEKQALIDQLHARMLENEEASRSLNVATKRDDPCVERQRVPVSTTDEGASDDTATIEGNVPDSGDSQEERASIRSSAHAHPHGERGNDGDNEDARGGDTTIPTDTRPRIQTTQIEEDSATGSSAIRRDPLTRRPGVLLKVLLVALIVWIVLRKIRGMIWRQRSSMGHTIETMSGANLVDYSVEL